MSNFYTMQMMAYEAIDKRLTSCLEKDVNINVNQLILEVTRQFPISPKAVKKRIELYVAANKDHLQILDDEVVLR